MATTEKIIEALKESYEPYADIAVSELKRIDSLREKWEQTKDPEWLAFRENPKTQALFKSAVNTYKALYKQMANDDGSLSQLDRAKMDVGKKWAIWFVRSLGGDPVKIRRQVEAEIKSFADSAGIEV